MKKSMIVQKLGELISIWGDQSEVVAIVNTKNTAGFHEDDCKQYEIIAVVEGGYLDQPARLLLKEIKDDKSRV